jgi:hypothetical protein
MRFCTNCHRFTAGQPLFCATCGRTYNVRLCPRQHVNPRAAEVCSQCGSHDLTQPQPRTGIGTALAVRSIARLPGIALLAFSVWLFAEFFRVLLTSEEVQSRLMLLLLMLGMAWLAYTHLPPGMRPVARWGWRAAKRLARRR